MNKITVVKGDGTSIYKVFVDGYSDLSNDAWKCTIYLKQKIDPNSTELVKRTAQKKHDSSKNEDYFECYLLPTDTKDLTEKKYYMIFLIENTALSVPYRRQYQTTVYITPSAV